MTSLPVHGRLRRLLVTTTAATLALCAPSFAQKTTFSIDFHGPSVGSSSCGTGVPFADADILRPNTPTAQPKVGVPNPPCLVVRGGFGAGTLQLALYPGQSEVDAMSYARDARLQSNMPPGSIWFSVDEFAVGHPFGGPAPTVTTEATVGDHAASVFIDTGLPSLPLPWIAGPIPNVEAIDGDGLPSGTGSIRPGVGIKEPTSPGMPPDLGDNLDAVDVDGNGSGIVLFSLAPAFFDGCSTAFNNDSAPPHGFSPAAIAATNLSGVAPVLWAPPAALGLDAFGFGTDDIDALAVWDNGNNVYNPPSSPFDWNATGGATDMVLFSVRRGSAVIGQPDSIFGDPIEEGDILMPPVAGGLSGFPGIVIPGEALGLATRRNGTGRFCGLPRFADDVDALDVTLTPQFDCNNNGIEDAVELATGGIDNNDNGVLDICERPLLPFTGPAFGGSIRPR